MSGCFEVAFGKAAVGMVNGCDQRGTSCLQESVVEQEGTPELALKLAKLPKKQFKSTIKVKAKLFRGCLDSVTRVTYF